MTNRFKKIEEEMANKWEDEVFQLRMGNQWRRIKKGILVLKHLKSEITKEIIRMISKLEERLLEYNYIEGKKK